MNLGEALHIISKIAKRPKLSQKQEKLTKNLYQKKGIILQRYSPTKIHKKGWMYYALYEIDGFSFHEKLGNNIPKKMRDLMVEDLPEKWKSPRLNYSNKDLEKAIEVLHKVLS